MSSGIRKLPQGTVFLVYLPLSQLPFTLMAPPVYASILIQGHFWANTAALIHCEQTGPGDIPAHRAGQQASDMAFSEKSFRFSDPAPPPCLLYL